MKRKFSLLLAGLLSLGCFYGCDGSASESEHSQENTQSSVSGSIEDSSENNQSENSESGSSESSSESQQPEDNKSQKIDEASWKAAFEAVDMTNLKVHTYSKIAIVDEASEVFIEDMIINDKKAKIIYYNDNIPNENYIAEIDDVMYTCQVKDGQAVWTTDTVNVSWEYFEDSLQSQYGLYITAAKGGYSTCTYDETSGVYYAEMTSGSATSRTEVTFKDGKLYSLKIESSTPSVSGNGSASQITHEQTLIFVKEEVTLPTFVKPEDNDQSQE